MKTSDLIISDIRSVLSGVSDDCVEAICGMILSAKKIMLCGYGRSGLVAKGFAMRLAQLGIFVQVVGETTATAIGNDDLLIIVSASGKTAGLYSMQKLAVDLGAKTLIVTGSANSKLSLNSDMVVVLPRVEDNYPASIHSRQPLGSLFEQCSMLLLDSVVLSIMELMGESSDNMKKRHANLE